MLDLERRKEIFKRTTEVVDSAIHDLKCLFDAFDDEPLKKQIIEGVKANFEALKSIGKHMQ